MEIGVCLPTFPFGASPTRERILEVARAAEEMGYDSVWASDHLLPPANRPRYGTLFECLTTLAYVAGQTRRVRLGTSVLVLPLRHAVEVAKQVATLDALSGGRVILGVGAGWIPEEFAALGADFRHRGRHLDEAIRVLRLLWSEPRPSFAGTFYQFRDVLFGPLPVQPGGPPIWVGGYTDAALRRAARLGDAWHGDDVAGAQLASMVARLRVLAAREGRTVGVTLRRTVDLRPLLAAERLASAGVQDGRFPTPTAGALTGSADEVAAGVREALRAGVDHFICQFEHATSDEHLASMRVFQQEIVDRIRSETIQEGGRR
ncbi:MAG: LLM class F420-dependent oxidoreductase [Armatimonadota bacterium]|nr:LLM class F420-dependent oxidoreductase [Armatimonadota bacterium]MDR7544919.1 LLM class F420-dependent oxidoreductase [Armatimonadota bacterium]MDR7611767.1 LLM class F420-dependent oxidoreductase [Armatimonadota bacterium]